MQHPRAKPPLVAAPNRLAPDLTELDEPTQTEADTESTLDRFLRRAPAALVSVIVHLVVLICLALLTMQLESREDPLVIEAGQSSAAEPVIDTLVIETVDPVMTPEQEPSVPVTVDLVSAKLEASPQSVMPSLPAIDSGLIGETVDYSPSFRKRLLDAQKHGIEIVVVFDSTGSMGGEIDAVKRRIHQIGTAVMRKIPKARFSLVTYRDLRDQYVVRGIPLGDNVGTVQQFINSVSAGGGGDQPEAVQEGMRWAIHNNQFREYSQKVMLIFGDAPPHPGDLRTCLSMASDFRENQKASVNTITCRKSSPLPEFYMIAQAGGGEAFVMSGIGDLMKELLVITFGASDREQVLKFFEVDDLPQLPQRRMRRFRGMPRSAPGR